LRGGRELLGAAEDSVVDLLVGERQVPQGDLGHGYHVELSPVKIIGVRSVIVIY